MEPEYHPQNKPKSAAYKRLSIELSLAVLKEYPLFALWRPACFQRFLERVIEEDEKEVVSTPLRFETMSDIICRAYYKRLSGKKGTQSVSQICSRRLHIQDPVYHSGLEHAKTLLEQANTSTHPIFYRSVACHLSLFLGYLSTVRDETDLTYNWRPEFIEMLDLFCHDEEGSIRKLAWSVDTLSVVSATPYSRLL